MNVRNIPERWASSLVAVVGIGGVTLVLIAVLSIAAGFQQGAGVVGLAGRRHHPALGFDQRDELGLRPEPGHAHREGPGIKQDEKGNPLVLRRALRAHRGQAQEQGRRGANLPFRGVSPSAPLLRKSFKIEEGTHDARGHERDHRRRRRGRQLREHRGRQDGALGQRGLGRSSARFSDDGGIAESEAWGDARLVQQVWNRGTSFQSVRVRLTDESDATFKKLKDTLTKDPQLQVAVPARAAVLRGAAGRSCPRSSTARAVFFAIMMGLAAIFAAVNTMLNAVASRVREIATLRAMGFGAAPVVFSVLVEALLLGAAGGLLGGLLALVFLNGMQSSTMNFQTFSQITYAFTVTPQLMVTGIIYGLVLTFIAGMLPGHSRRAHADHLRVARVVRRRSAFRLRRAGSGWRSSAESPGAQNWADVEGRIQYAYYTEDARALNSVLTSLKPKPVEGESECAAADAASRAYFRALTHYRLAQVLSAGKKSQAQERDRRLRRGSRPRRRSTAEGAAWPRRNRRGATSARRSLCARHGLHARRPRDELDSLRRRPHRLAHRRGRASSSRRIRACGWWKRWRPSSAPARTPRRNPRRIKKLRAVTADVRSRRAPAPPPRRSGAPPKPMHFSARALYDQRDVVGAREALERALLIAPDYAFAKRLMAQITR